MEEFLAVIRSLEIVLSSLVFALMLIVSIISFSRSSHLRDLWESAVTTGRLEKISQEDLLQPWLVRIYQRGRTYRLFGSLLLSITGVILLQVLYRQALVTSPTLSNIFVVIRMGSVLATTIILLSMTFATHTGLREEVQQLRKLLPNHGITLQDLISLHESDQYFVLRDTIKTK